MADSNDPGSASFWTAGRILAIVLAFVVLALAVANFNEVSVNFLLFTLKMPLFFLIVGALVLGYLAGWLSRKSGK
ncbi:MAG: LapA family protein [Chloroflexi bacterium]|nr:LapA family protein [Chloroflexota bacterium]